MTGESRVAVIAALLANLAIAILKLIAGFISRSASMMAEAAHSFSDTGNQVLLLLGLRLSKKEPDEDHPYGTGKAAYFWPFLVAILLFGVAGGYSFAEGVRKTLHPHPLEDIGLALGVLAASFGIEAVSLTIALREARRTARARGITTLRQFLDENRDASLLTVLVEDALALVGLPIAALAILASKATGNPAWDGVGSLVIGLLLMSFAGFLGWEVRGLLLGRGLTRRDAQTVRRLLETDPAVERVVNFRSMYLGPDVVLLGVEVVVKDHLAGPALAEALAQTERALIAAVPHLKYVYLEPVPTAEEEPTPAAEVRPHAAHEEG